jgi:predicted O-linked N-acetylglucosamine transferase (SPINDLY family)
MDYRISDPYLDPPGIDESVYSEKTVRLPHGYWCYEPPAEAPQVNPLPAISTRQITFGCLNNYAKVSEPTLRMWSALLREVGAARLIVFSREGPHRRRALELIAAEGVDPKRLVFVDAVVTPQYFRRYHEIDIALDPFPFCGGTTTCDSLWMGVPVVSLAGATAVSRAGLSILSNVGLAELVAKTPEEYVKVASDLAGNASRLAELRLTLRDRMLHSPLMDARGFARDMGNALRQMWREWSIGAQGTGGSQ